MGTRSRGLSESVTERVGCSQRGLSYLQLHATCFLPIHDTQEKVRGRTNLSIFPLFRHLQGRVFFFFFIKHLAWRPGNLFFFFFFHLYVISTNLSIVLSRKSLASFRLHLQSSADHRACVFFLRGKLGIWRKNLVLYTYKREGVFKNKRNKKRRVRDIYIHACILWLSRSRVTPKP
jgi:hypothetical protein